ncbi:MAG: hypothetical protein NDJ89_03600 [Oligoflexia bacterium]|nr:hypothetical protein [Oligoflexia bacterium]
MKIFRQEERESGASGILPILLILGLVAAGMISFSTLQQLRATGLSASFKKLVARQAAKSAFLIMEAALRRRLWEMPPDSRCLKSTAFYVEGNTPDGADYRVDTSYDPATNTLSMTALASYKGARAKSEKKIKILDTSDFLIFSKGNAPTQLARVYDATTPIGFIGRNRKVYFEGPVTFSGVLDRPSYPTNWTTPTPAILPGELGTILQGERMYFLKGVSYSATSSVVPNYEPWRSMIQPLGLNRLPQNGAGAAFFTSDHALAGQLEQAVKDGSMLGLPSASTLKKQVYPIALFCGNAPLNPQFGTDNGCYINDPDRWFVIYVDYGAAHFGHRADYTCLKDTSATNPKHCSSSGDFPNGFRKWRKDAGLENVLYGSDGTPLSYPPVNWDNLEALKEDAAACGLLTSAAALPVYQDCDLSNTRIVNDYVAGVNSCERISRLDPETIPGLLNNFNAADYSDPALKDRLLRRVVYSDRPIEIPQSAASGLMTSLADPTLRQNLSLWVVNENRYILRPHQPDTTSPIDVDPARRRELYFNQDPAGALRPLNLVMLTPDQVQIISPFHVPYLYPDLLLAMPVVGGKIRPRNHVLTDSFHQENDGFKYGFRDIRIGDLTLITNPLPSGWLASSGFALRGLWGGGEDSSAAQFVRNACMFSDPVTQPVVDHASAPASTAAFPWIPASLPAAPDSILPPLGSRFYAPGGQVEKAFYPHVFVKQQNAIGYQLLSSRIFHKGVRILMSFDSSTPGGKRNLASPLLLPGDYRDADLSNRRYAWNSPYYYVNTANSSCVPSTTMNGDIDGMTTMIQLNIDRNLYLQSSPGAAVTKMGSLTGVELPVVEIAR